MSYDIRIGVKVDGAEDLYAVIARPEYDSPTYNLGTMFRKCTGWDYKQGEWYYVPKVLPLIEHGIHELRFNEEEYRKYNAPNGWGTTEQALDVLDSLLACIIEQNRGTFTENQIPLEFLYVKW